ncbi:large ribosomal subunit protein bL32m-like [Nyctibius grandis]|uniref:large ribosomal subunit protein bL32m-like n=1 Tax=Nyctibius grandis TaxID=48427 RepID=UPI0035BC526F
MAARAALGAPLPRLRGLRQRCWGRLERGLLPGFSGGQIPPRNIDICPECGNLKQKHIFCGYCCAKVKAETPLIQMEIHKKEGGPFNAPAVETVVLYDGEKLTEKDEGKWIIERARKRPSWFVQN